MDVHGGAGIGAGDADLSWSAVAGIEYRFKRWGGLRLDTRRSVLT
jgi:hypothetical protein